jgi:hypothetical protein
LQNNKGGKNTIENTIGNLILLMYKFMMSKEEGERMNGGVAPKKKNRKKEKEKKGCFNLFSFYFLLLLTKFG